MISKDSCAGWENGFGGDKIDNTNGEAIVYIPKYCEMKIRAPMMAWYKLTKECKNQKMFVDNEKWSERTKARTSIKRIGYQRPERYPNIVKIDEDHYVERVNQDIIDMDDPSIPQDVKDSIEITVDMTHPEGHYLEVHLKKNVTRAQEMKELRDKILEEDKVTGNTERIDQDVLILYIDHVARAHFHRKLPKTSAWLGRFKSEDRDLASFEFFRYQTTSKTTVKSNNSMYYGDNAEKNLDETKDVFRFFSENGYITGMFKGGCDMTSVRYEDIGERPEFYSYDHYGSSFSCDKNYDIGNNHNLALSKGRNSHFRRCIYGRDMHDIQLEYVTQFWGAYPDNRKMFRTHLSYAHETTGELIGSVDDAYAEFLEKFYQKGYLSNTQVFFISDHGSHFVTVRTPFIMDDSRLIENSLPLLFHLTPKTIKPEYLSNLKENQQLFLNSHDIYATLKSVAVGKISGSPLIYDHSYIHTQLPRKRD